MGKTVKGGLFITLEGGEGCGKTTQVKLICEYLESLGYEVVLTEEPGGTPTGDHLRRILLEPGFKIGHKAELFLFEAIRCQHMEEVICPALEAGKIVICSRFCDATLVYQGYGRKMDKQLIATLNEIASDNTVPDLTLLLDLEVACGIERARNTQKAESAKGQLDRIESEKLQFHETIREGYLDIAAKNPDRVKIINARLGVEEVFNQIKDTLTCLLPA